MSEYKISVVPANMIECIWHMVEPIIKRPIDLSHDEVTLEVAKETLMNGGIMLVVITKKAKIIAINTLEVRTFPTGKKVLYIPLTGGDDLDCWMDTFIKTATQIALGYNCTHLRGLAVRDGWLRKLKHLGFEPISTTIEMEIEK